MSSNAPDHALVVHAKLSDNEFGTPEERMAAYELEDRLEKALRANGSGVLDGHEFGGGEFCVFAYGMDADRLRETLEPVIRSFGRFSGHLVVRHGPPGSPSQSFLFSAV